MDPNRYTEKSQEALQSAQRLPSRRGHQQMDVEYLLMALLDQERGLASSILKKAEVSVDAVKVRLHRELEKLPRVSGDSSEAPGMTRRLAHGLLGQAEEEAKKLKDGFISVEHLLLGMAEDPGTTGRVLKEFGVTRA